MDVKCPNCGSMNSLDALIADAGATDAMRCLLELDAEIGRAAIRYIGLSRLVKSQLS